MYLLKAGAAFVSQVSILSIFFKCIVSFSGYYTYRILNHVAFLSLDSLGGWSSTSI